MRVARLAMQRGGLALSRVQPLLGKVRSRAYSGSPVLHAAGNGDGANNSNDIGLAGAPSVASTSDPTSHVRKVAQRGVGGAPTQVQPSDALTDAKECERENKALLAENEALLAENKALLAKNEALLAENKELDKRLDEAERTGNASLANRLQRTMEDNRKAMEDNRKAMEGNNKAMEDNRKAMERNDKAMEDNRKAMEDNREAVNALKQRAVGTLQPGV
jgi:hypothetical protein